MEGKKRVFIVSLVFLIVTYLVGIGGFMLPQTKALFVWLTPFHLIFTALLICANDRWHERSIWIYAMFSSILGYGVEVLGVHTKLIFGSYTYGATLGLKVFEVPLMIGLNWFITTYIVGTTIKKTGLPIVWQIALGAVVLTALDALIEPVAVANDFWSWEKGIIPLHNSIGWYATSCLMLFIFHKIKFTYENPLTIYVLIAQTIFFLTLGLV